MKVHEQVRNSLILSYIIVLDDTPHAWKPSYAATYSVFTTNHSKAQMNCLLFAGQHF